MHFLNSQPFLEFLQNLTGIEETLVPDPYFEGGGCHQIKSGGFLKVHVDFHKHKMMGLDRRVNVLVYLNEDWDEAWGGHFELWEKDMSKCVTRIAPFFNRMAIFSTTDFSWHGHPDALACPPDRSRKSLALYYYTNGRPDSEVSEANRQRITTTFAARKGQDSTKMTAFNNMVNLANDLLPPIVVKGIKKFRKN
ncbi:MAG: 2OG-Fe(II) oxygenase [Bacteroidetes bacterium]|nr:2OG-Fe(II) oxygenase [Bacteroidota bacterium]